MKPVAASKKSLYSAIALDQPTRLGIDGLDGLGKSHLARDLADAFGFKDVELDSFVMKNRGGYVDFIDYDKLRLSVPPQSFVIEGVCLRQIAKIAGIELDYHIYIQRMHLGAWADEEYLGLDQDPDIYIKSELELMAKLNNLDEPEADLGLEGEIIHYHHKFQPQKAADFVLECCDN